jgi:hypothetical protein
LRISFENPTNIYYKGRLSCSVAKNMHKQDFCEICNHKDHCQDVFRQIGKAQGPSVVFKVVLAFLLPIVVFIASLAASERVLAGVTNEKELRTALGFLLALLVTFGLILLTRAINRLAGKDKRDQNFSKIRYED